MELSLKEYLQIYNEKKHHKSHCADQDADSSNKIPKTYTANILSLKSPDSGQFNSRSMVNPSHLESEV